MFKNIRWIFLLVIVLMSTNIYPQEKTSKNFTEYNPDNSSSSHNIPIHMDITELAINRFIALQTFPELTGTIPGTGHNYHIYITRPTVYIRTNLFQARFSIIINSDLGNYVVPIAPNISIPQLSISYNEINAFFVNFESLINQSILPNSLKQIIINGYNSTNLATFPSRILNSALQNIPDFIDISVQDIGFQFNTLDRKLRFTVTPQITGHAPVFTAHWMKRGVEMLSLRFGSSIFTTARDIKMYDDLGEEILYAVHNVDIPKGGFTSALHFYDINAKPYYVHAIFNSPFGEYIRTYRFIFDTQNYNTWHTMANYGGGTN